MPRRITTLRLGVMLAVALIGAAIAIAFGEWVYAPTIGWCGASLVYSAWVWFSIRGMDATATRDHASREEPNRTTVDLMIVLLSVASLFAVGFVLVHASGAHGAEKALLAALALTSVALSWLLLHTLYTLRYARLFYRHDGGIDFNQKADPQYTDFAYLSFTLGMTFQVSDTNITTHQVRATALGHSLLSFLFGSVILASTVNLIAGLSS